VPTLIRDRYELLETLGAGGEARVVKALDRQHGRFIALKIRPVRDGTVRDLLLNEARVLLAVPPHPALPLVREDFFEGNDYVVAMDWVDGTDLARLVADRGRPGLAPSSVLMYLSDAAQALTHLHSQSPAIIHGDVKPGNLILTTGGRVKLVDFGMSSAPNAARRRVGTPGFRAPELAASGRPSRASDIYALAATAFALLTGSAPAGVLPSWEGIDPAQAEQLEAAIRLGMATDPARRPGTAGELVERLRAGWAQALPTGVVTFCLSDIEGSTAMWESDPAAMAEALVRHDELIADCASACGGRMLASMGEGDSTVSVFDAAGGALDAAIASTRALATEHWPAGLRVATRFGLHTGEADRRGATYFGPSINLAARLRAQADGGQIFLSAVTADVVRDHLPPGCSLVDLGPHRLKGLAAPERVHALKGPGVNAPRPATECPYRGLLPFTPEDREFFFGREDVTAELIGRLRSGRVLAVVGASGSGKSSVLRAGVVAGVRAGEVAGVDSARLMTPGDRPTLHDNDKPAELIVVDQFEELFTLCDDADRRRAFIDALLAARGPVAIGVRADIYGRLAGHPELARAVAANQLLLGAMSVPELERAVTEPARLAGLRLEPGLVELAVRDVAGEPGALPLLSHALRATWERRDGRTLTVAGYRDSGGVAAAVARTADEVVGSMPAEQRQLTRNVFLRLTALGDAPAATRRRVPIEELVPEGAAPEVVPAVLDRLVDARLVTLGEGTAEVAHEVLLREWPTLRGWLEEDLEGVRLHRQLGDAVRIWEAGGREPSDLYRGARLTAAADWARGDRERLNATERSFIDASLAAADRERRAQLRTNRRLRGLLSGAVALLLVAILAGVVALVQRGDARAQALTADAERVGAQAQNEQDVDRQLLFGVAGVRLHNGAQTRSDLMAVLQKNPALTNLSRPFTNTVTAEAVSPDGRLLAVADLTGIVRFIDLATRRATGRDVELGAPVATRAITFSPDGRTVLAVRVTPRASTLEAIDVADRRVRTLDTWRLPPAIPPLGSDGVAYSPDGRSVAVSVISESAATRGIPSAAGLAMVDPGSGRIRWQRPYPKVSSIQEEPHVTFTPGGTLLTSAQQGETILWDTATGRILRRFAIGGLPAISPDGRLVALGRNSSFVDTVASATVAVLNLRTGRHRTLQTNLPAAWIRGISFTSGDSRIVADAFDGVHVWDVASGTLDDSWVGQPGQRSVMAIDAGRTTVFVGAQDGSVATFDLTGHRRLGQDFSWDTPSGGCAGDTSGPCDVVSPRSDLLADSQGNGGIAIVDLRTLRLRELLPPRDGYAADAVSFTPDGGTVVDGGTNGRVTMWNLATGRISHEFRFSGTVEFTAVSPDGRLLAAQTDAPPADESHVTVVRIATGRMVATHTVGARSDGLAFTPNGREVVALGCCQPISSLAAWDVRGGRQLFRRTLTDQGDALALTPDGRLIGVGTQDGKVLFLDPLTGATARPPLQADAGNIEYLAFSPDSREFAVGAADNTVSVWDLPSRMRIGNPFGPYSGLITPGLFEPDGQLLVILEEEAVQWPMNVGRWETYACQAAGRNLTRAEWADVVPNRPYERICPARATRPYS
jgi:class 3 adenylate cyclase/WD40 repeat protein